MAKNTLEPIWQPNKDSQSSKKLSKFIDFLKNKYQSKFELHPSEYQMHSLYQWSIKNKPQFWESVWDFFKITGTKNSNTDDSSILKSNPEFIKSSFFPHAKLNFAKNLIHIPNSETASKPAISFYGENKTTHFLSYQELASEVIQLRKQLIDLNITKGDVVAAIVPHCPIAIIGMLATTSLGAIWTSCSPDFGVEGVLDRFGQTNPKVLITTDGYRHKEKVFPLADKISKIQSQLSSKPHIFWSNYTDQEFNLGTQIVLENKLELKHIQDEINSFEDFDFNLPVYIMYSSGTTGKPKCIVHRAGGVLIEHIKEWGLHVEADHTDVCFYQTTCGWMMWNWLVSALFFKVKLVLFDGFALLDDGKFLFNLIDKEKISIFGTNAKFLSLVEKAGVQPSEFLSLESLHTILSTGSPLSPESFNYVYSEIKKDVCLSSISGGTDILGCFALGSPTLPVYQGQLQCRSLGLEVECFDDDGNAVRESPGELVCLSPFPSQPIGFWNDKDDQKFKEAYFEKFPNIWAHGDLITITEHDSVIIWGRSDTTLNPGGVRIGSAEIYNQVETLDFIEESIVIGRRDFAKQDETVVLFVKLKPAIELTENHKKEISNLLRSKCSPFHVPKEIYQVSDIPKTRSGKIVEAAVRALQEDKEIKNIEAIANPECLKEFTRN